MVIEIVEHREREERRALFHGFRFCQLCLIFANDTISEAVSFFRSVLSAVLCFL